MGLTGQMDIIGADGLTAGVGAIDPALWQANASALQAYAASRGVSLDYYDSFSPGEVEFNIATVADAQAEIDHYANLTEATATGPAPASSGATLGGSSSGSALPLFLAALAGIGLVVALAAAGERAAEAPRGYRGADTRRERDELAEANIPPDLLALWRQEKARYHGTPHERSERFLEWAETGEGERARLELLEQSSRERVEELVLDVDGCTCHGDDSPRCCGRGCCSWHQGIRERIGQEVPF